MNKKLVVNFQDIYFLNSLPEKAREKLKPLSSFGEYWAIELEVTEDGDIVSARFVDYMP